MNTVVKIPKSATFSPKCSFKICPKLDTRCKPAAHRLLAYALYRKLINFDQITFINKRSVSLYFKRKYMLHNEGIIFHLITCMKIKFTE